MKILEMETPAGNKSTFHKIKINEYNDFLRNPYNL